MDFDSPEYMQTSLAAAITLGFRPGLFYRDARLKGLNLLTTYASGCIARCGYCGMARGRKPTREKTFIRVAWPRYRTDEIIAAVNREDHDLERVCVGMITHPNAFQDALTTVKRFKKETSLLISVLIAPTLMKPGMLNLMREAGADRCGVAIDCATPELFQAYRGSGIGGPHVWDRYWQMVEEACQVFGKGKAGVHLIVGLGETELDMVEAIQRAQDLGALIHLFSFFPEEGSYLEERDLPPIGQYRRIQLARYLINHCGISKGQMSFNEHGQLVDFGVPKDELEQIVMEGTAFMTSGCPGKDGQVACNRPYGNERPSQAIRNFPFPPEAEDLVQIREQLYQY
ncbi:MAG TPA: radical SAM protein [Clostridia bacterium]|nr:radical SAM protein [Clostridia bacterium]